MQVGMSMSYVLFGFVFSAWCSARNMFFCEDRHVVDGVLAGCGERGSRRLEVLFEEDNPDLRFGDLWKREKAGKGGGER